MTPCQDGMAVLEHLKMDVRSKLCPDGAVIQEWSQPLERLCSCCSEREQPCQDSTVNQEHSSANIGTEKKFKTSAVKYMTAVELDLPGPRMNEPSSIAGLPMHLDSATNSKCSRTNINKMKHNVSSDSPWDRGESQLQLPKCEVPQDRHASQRCVSGWQMPQPKVNVENKSVDTTQWSCQLGVCDLGHKSQQLSQQLRHETHDSPHATQWSTQQKTCDASHASQIFQNGLRVLCSTSTMRHHLQGQVVPTCT